MSQADFEFIYTLFWVPSSTLTQFAPLCVTLRHSRVLAPFAGTKGGPLNVTEEEPRR